MSTVTPTPKHLPGLTWIGTMTDDEFAALPEDGRRLELLDGEVYMAAQPRLDHSRFSLRLGSRLLAWVLQHSLGDVFVTPDMRLAPSWSPVPDLAFVATVHFARLHPNYINGPADLSIEILSPSTEAVDRGLKFREYARHGVQWYWIVDLDAQTLEEYENVNGAFVLRQTVPFSVLFSPRLFPGLTIDLAACL